VPRPICETLHKLKGGLGWFAAAVCAIALSACSSSALPAVPAPSGSSTEKAERDVAMGFQIESDVFEPGGPIPSKFSCDGQDVSPPLSWSGVPEGTSSLALVMEDPDAPAGIWVHWVLYNIPANLKGLSEGVPAEQELANGTLSGLNSWRRRGYGGPCPPAGTHRYYFRLYALDGSLGLQAGATKERLSEAMQGHILGQTEIMGTYSR